VLWELCRRSLCTRCAAGQTSLARPYQCCWCVALVLLNACFTVCPCHRVSILLTCFLLFFILGMPVGVAALVFMGGCLVPSLRHGVGQYMPLANACNPPYHTQCVGPNAPIHMLPPARPPPPIWLCIAYLSTSEAMHLSAGQAWP